MANNQLSQNNKADVIVVQEEVKRQLASPEVMQTLIANVFKDFTPVMVQHTLIKGILQGYTFQDFLAGRVYAIKYGKDGFNIVEAIEHVRSIAQQAGQVGKSKPIFVTDENGKIVSCEITVKKLMQNGTIGDFTAEVYFDEYYAGNKNKDGSIKKNQWGDVKEGMWDTKPRTMIAKVAEMHALRMAFPDVIKGYVEEEFQKGNIIDITPPKVDEDKVKEYLTSLETITTLEDLKKLYFATNKEVREFPECLTAKDNKKAEIEKAINEDKNKSDVVDSVDDTKDVN